MSLDPPQTLNPGCDCGACCDSCGHEAGCNALIPEAACDCPEDTPRSEHLDACPEWQAELAARETWQ